MHFRWRKNRKQAAEAARSEGKKNSRDVGTVAFDPHGFFGVLMKSDASPTLFCLLLPGNRVARVPLTVLEAYVDQTAKLTHGPEGGEDVTAHNMAIDAATGTSTWHTEWELGPCDFMDDSGFPQHAYAWHRHPLGTEYTEIYQK